MKCLTIQQPWASLIAVGAKKFETRSWPTNHRGTLAIPPDSDMPGMTGLTSLLPGQLLPPLGSRIQKGNFPEGR